MKSIAELRAELYDLDRDTLEVRHKVAEQLRDEARQKVKYAEEAAERAGNYWLAVHGRLYPLVEDEWKDLKAHPIPGDESAWATTP